MLAHLYMHKGRLAWSGYGATGDPAHRPYAMVISVPSDFILTSDKPPRLYPLGKPREETWTPEALALAARRGMFGLTVIEDTEPESRKADVVRQARPRGRRRLTLTLKRDIPK